MTYKSSVINIAVKKLKKHTKCQPIEESVLNLYIHSVCYEVIENFNLDIKKGMNKKYIKFFDEVKDKYLNE